jgi:nondiscriminating aspartyl-tRNA synthetase
MFGGENIRNEILNLLKTKKIPFEHIVHQETVHHNVAKEIGVHIQEGLKCLIVRGKKSQINYLIGVRGNQKVDMKALSVLVSENCELEKTEKIKERFGLDIGGIPPFSFLLGIEAYFDQSIQDCKSVIFSCGLKNESIRMHVEDLLPLLPAHFASFVKVKALEINQ